LKWIASPWLRSIQKLPKYFFVVNPVSGRGRGQAVGKEVESLIRHEKLQCEVVYTERPWHAAELAQDAAKHYDIIVCVGGDGTLNEVVNGIYGTHKPLGIIPVGTGNDFVRAVHIPFQTGKAFRLLMQNHRRTIDLGKANERYFHNGVGIGFDAHVVNTSNRVRHLKGNAVYLYSVLKTLLSYRPHLIKVAIDGKQTIRDFFMVTVGNGTSLGGGFYLTPDAKMDDGTFDLCLIQNMPVKDILINLIKVYRGRHKEDPRVDIQRARVIQFSSEQGFAVHADGELLTMNSKSLKIEIVPAALEIIA